MSPPGFPGYPTPLWHSHRLHALDIKIVVFSIADVMKTDYIGALLT